MPIKFSFKKLPVDADGKSYDSLEAFQAAELAKLLSATNACGISAEDIVNAKDDVIEILELTMDARPAARGVPKKRKAKASAPVDELPIESPQPQVS
jgi:hypothetical protein